MLQETMHIVHMAIRSEFYIIIFSFFFNFYSHVQQTDLRNDKIFQIILTTKSQSLYKTLLSYTICIQKEIQRMWYYSLLFFFYLFTHLTVLGNYKVFQRNTENANISRYIYNRYLHIHHQFHYS